MLFNIDAGALLETAIPYVLVFLACLILLSALIATGQRWMRYSKLPYFLAGGLFLVAGAVAAGWL